MRSLVNHAISKATKKTVVMLDIQEYAEEDALAADLFMATLSPTTLVSTSVMMLPGPTAFTLILCGASASAMHLQRGTPHPFILQPRIGLSTDTYTLEGHCFKHSAGCTSKTVR